MKAIVLAAGLGSRLNPLTSTRPKHLLPIAGKPILLKVLEALYEAGIREVGLVVHYYEDKIRSMVGDGNFLGLKLTYIHQPELNGTAGALEAAKDYADNSDIVVIYGDVTVNGRILKTLIERFQSENVDAAVVGVKVKNPWEFGVFELDGRYLKRVVEKPKKEEVRSNLINTGVYAFTPRVFEALDIIDISPRGEKELTDALQVLASNGRVLVVDCGGGWWFDIGRPWDLLDANKAELSRVENTLIMSEVLPGVRVIGDVVVGKDTEIMPGAVLVGPSYIGSNVKIGYNTVIGPYASICDGVEVGPLSYVAGSIIMGGSQISSHCSVFESIIGEEVYIESGVKIPSVNIYGGNIKVLIKGRKIDSGRTRLGAIIGDRVKVGANASFAPGVVVMPSKTIPPNSYIAEDVV